MPQSLSMKRLLELNTGSGRRSVENVFADFCEFAALSIRNAVSQHRHAEREQRFLQLAERYRPEEMQRFGQLLGFLTFELEQNPRDVLGELYMALDLGKAGIGQFFTPYEVSLMLAQLSLQDVGTKLRTQPFITMSEPSCGAGGMCIAAAQVLTDAGFNPQQQLHITAWDLDPVAVHMSYVQLSLLNIPSVVVHGNTLTLETTDAWPTPAHIWGAWDFRLAAHRISHRRRTSASEE